MASCFWVLYDTSFHWSMQQHLLLISSILQKLPLRPADPAIHTGHRSSFPDVSPGSLSPSKKQCRLFLKTVSSSMTGWLGLIPYLQATSATLPLRKDSSTALNLNENELKLIQVQKRNSSKFVRYISPQKVVNPSY